MLAPNLTIYEKLIHDFTPSSPKFVFKSVAEFADSAPEVITGDTYEQCADLRSGSLFAPIQINTEVRGGRAPRIKRLSEYFGQSYFEYLAELPELVLLMSVAHRCEFIRTVPCKAPMTRAAIECANEFAPTTCHQARSQRHPIRAPRL